MQVIWKDFHVLIMRKESKIGCNLFRFDYRVHLIDVLSFIFHLLKSVF